MICMYSLEQFPEDMVLANILKSAFLKASIYMQVPKHKWLNFLQYEHLRMLPNSVRTMYAVR